MLQVHVAQLMHIKPTN